MAEQKKIFLSSVAVVTTVFLVLFGTLLGITPAKAAIEFNTFPVKYDGQLNSDYPLIDARNITGNGNWSTSQADHDDGVQANSGDRILFRIYYHNANTPGNIATNVILKAIFPGSTRQNHEIRGSISSDQSSAVFSDSGNRGGNITIQINGSPQTLNFLPGTLRFFPNRTLSGQTLTNGDNIATTGVNIGSVNGCFDFSGSVTFEAQVGTTTSDNRDLTITKRVLNVTRGDTSYQDSVSAVTGERVRYQITFSTTGNISQNNVRLKDILPGNMSFVSNSLRINSTTFSGDENLFSGNGRNFGTIASNTTNTITFETEITGSFSSTQTLTNTAEVVSDQVGTRQSTARVFVSGSTSTSRDLRITKRVLNISRGETSFRDSVTASPNERVRFEIRTETLGNDTQSNVIVRDILPNNLFRDNGTMRLDGSTVSSSFEAEVFGSGRNLGTLSQNTVRILTFEATLAGESQFTSSNTTLNNTANVRSDQVSTRQAEARVEVSRVLSSAFQIRKSAFNLTQGVDATTVAANSGDTITYSLFYKNTGGSTLQNVVIEDNIADVLELARLTNSGDGFVDNNIIRFPSVSVSTGLEVTKIFQVNVREASSFPTFSDLVMVNIYGNEIRIPVRRPLVSGVTTPPRTGAGEWLAGTLAGLVTFGYWVYRERHKQSLI